MSWICPKCETENPDDFTVCEVCESLKEIHIPVKPYISKQPLSFLARYYISGRPGSYTGSDLISLYLPRGTRIRKMLTDEWVPIERYEIPEPHVSESSYYYARGMKGVFKLSQLRSMHLPKSHLIREMFTELWFPIGDL